MSYAPNQPRLLADYAAAPTRRERTGTRRYWQAAQGDMFARFADDLVALADDVHAERTPCAVCASVDHVTDACPHGAAVELFPTTTTPEETGPMHTSTSAQRDENRLTPEDVATMAAAVEEFARRTPTMGTGERYTTAERIAHRAIGCDERDLRDSELLAVRQMFKPILAKHSAGSVTR